MKKRLGIVSAIVAVALVLALVFVLLVSAEQSNEATLTVKNAAGESSTLTGSYDEVVEALNSSISALGEGTATIKLNSNATATKQLVLTGSGVESVTVDLAGYTLDVSGIASAPIVVGGVKYFELNGGYSSAADRGAIVSRAAEAEGVIVISDSEQLSAYNIYDLVISYAATGATAVAHQDDDELILRNVDLIWNGAAAEASSKMISAYNGELTLINSSLTDITASGGSIGIVAAGTTVRLENTEITADYAYSMNGGTWLTAVDATFDASEAIFTANDPTDDVVIGAGVIFKGKILGEGATKDMIKLYYGTGSTLIDSDPADSVTVATAMADLTQLESGKWTLLEKKSTETIYTQIFDRGAITEVGDKLANAAAKARTVSEDKSVFTIAFIQNKEYDTASILLSSTSGNGKTSLFLDLNGYTITQKKGSHFFGANGLFRMSIDGMDAEGKMGTAKNIGYAGGTIYVSKSVEECVLTVRNVRLLNTNACGRVIKYLNEDGSAEDKKDSSASSNMMQLQDGRYYIDGIHFLYTGENYGRGVNVGIDPDNFDDYRYYYSTTLSAPMIMLQATAFVTAENSTFESAPDGEIVAKNIVAAPTVFSCATSSSALITASAFAKNCDFVNVGVVGSTGASEAHQIRVADSDISTIKTAFVGAANTYPILVTDCNISLAEGAKLASGKVQLLCGDGNMKIVTADGSMPEGSHTLEEGSALYFDTVSEGYIIVSGDSVTTVKLNKLFANGMVFQAGKPINVWGTCATDGATIKVTLGDNTAEATVVGGKWEATLPAMEYAKGLTLTVTEVGKAIGDTVFHSVDIGEVWAFSGQSNANLGAYKLEDFEEYKALADLYDNIRCFSVAANLTADPLDDPASAEWFRVTSATVGRADTGCGISAVGYVMATRLAVELEGNPTIAIIDINYNGKAISNFISNLYDPMAKAADAEHQLYNAMIAPLTGYNIKGFGWYQGEASSDSGECDDSGDGYYGMNVDQLYATYTETFNKNEGNEPLELFIVQLSVYMGNPSAIRSYQQDIAARNEHYHLISSSYAGSTLSDKDFKLDAGNGFQYGHVHAARKSPLGLAMADSILENVYFKDQDLKIANPEIESTVIDGASIKVTLDRDFTLMFGTEVEGFELSADGTAWVAARGTVDGRTITLTASGLTAPKYVRYGWGTGTIELETGEKILFSKSAEGVSYTADPASDKATTVTITAGGKTYTIHTADTEVLRSILNGNIIATNGHTLPVFSTAYKSSSAGTN